MVPITRASNLDELTEITNPAPDEVEDLRAAIEFDEELKGEAINPVRATDYSFSKLREILTIVQYCYDRG